MKTRPVISCHERRTSASTRARPGRAQRARSSLLAVSAVALAGLALLLAPYSAPAQSEKLTTTTLQLPAARLMERAQAEGAVSVIVALKPVAEGDADGGEPSSRLKQRAMAAAQQSLIAEMRTFNAHVIETFRYIPYIAMTVDPSALNHLLQLPGVLRVDENSTNIPTLRQSVPLVGADVAASRGADGSGYAVAVIDTGVDGSHSFLSGRVVSEACYSLDGNCPNGGAEQVGAGAGRPCSASFCYHGTHVAGIAAGMLDESFSGVARRADIIAIQVFGNDGSAFDSDIIKALERVYELRTTFEIAAANMSLGGESFGAPCPNAAGGAYQAIADLLASAGIATIAAAGNGYMPDALSSPACVPSIISVGSTSKRDEVSSFSNSTSFLDLLAPGQQIESSVLGDGYADLSGTSMAAPHVAGAFASLRSTLPEAEVSELLAALVDTGVPVFDSRRNQEFPRIQVDAALESTGFSVSATATPAPATAGGVVSYSVAATNASDEAVTGVTVSDRLPARTTYVAGSASDGGSFENGVLTWPAVDVPSGATIVRTFDIRVDRDLETIVSLEDDMESGQDLWSVGRGDGDVDWYLSEGNPRGGVRSWFAEDRSYITDQYLVTAAPVTIPPNATIHFWHDYATETGYDGGVVEVSLDGVAWEDLGPNLTQGPYAGTISLEFLSPIAGRSAFTGSSNGYMESIADLSTYEGEALFVRFRLATDSSFSGTGWYIDDVKIHSEAAIENIAHADFSNGQRLTTSLRTLVVPGNAQCVRLDVPDAVNCRVDRDCSVAVDLSSEGFAVSALTGGVAADIDLRCPRCESGSGASNGSCAVSAETCRFQLADTVAPFTPFADGEVANVTIRCDAEHSGMICTQAHDAFAPDGEQEHPVCEPQCVPFTCSSCQPGDCNQNDRIDAGDSICIARCVVGASSPTADCGCGADCNCTAGTEVSDIACSILRNLDAFGPNDPCLAAGSGFEANEAASAPSAVRLRPGRTAEKANGRKKKVNVSLRGSQASEVAVLGASLSVDEGSLGRIKLPRRLRRLGFSMQIERPDARHATAVISPSSVAPLPAMGKGTVLKVTMPVPSDGFAIDHAEFGSTSGLPLSR